MNSWWEGTTLRRRVYLGLVLLLVLFTAGVAWDPKGLRHYRELGVEEARLETDNARLHALLELRQKKARSLQIGDFPSLERLERENGYIKDDEVLFELR